MSEPAERKITEHVEEIISSGRTGKLFWMGWGNIWKVIGFTHSSAPITFVTAPCWQQSAALDV